MGKVVKTVAIAVAIGALTGGIGGFLAPAAFGATTTTAGFLAGAKLGLIGALISSGVSLVAQSFIKKPTMDLTETVGRLSLSVNAQAMGKFVFGETLCATDIVYAEQHGTNSKYISQVIGAASHRIQSFETLYVNDDTISFSGAAATGDYANTLWFDSNLGTDGQTHLTGTQSFAWPATADGRGLAHFLLQWALGKDKTESGLPSRISQVVKGIPVYDPRLDTTEGGSGSHRADDQSTWEYANGGTDIGANWALIVALYLLGWHTEDGNNNLVFGMGIDKDNIDWPSVTAAANVCEATVDSKQRYQVGGVFPTDQNHEKTIRQFEAAIGGRVAKFGGKYFLWAPNDDLTPFSSIGEADLVRDVGVEFIPSGPIEDLFNTARGLYVSASELYQPVPYPEVIESASVTEDGKTRVLEQNFSIIQDVSIAERVAREMIRRTRFSATWRFAMGPKGLLFQPFDVTTLNIAETNDTDTTVRIIGMTYSLSGVVIIECIEEDSSIYDTTTALGTPVTQLSPSSFDPATKVAVAGLAAATVSLTGSAGTVQDALKITWTDPGGLVAETQVQFRINGDTDWNELSPARVDFTQAILGPLAPNTNYDIRARHTTRVGQIGAWSATINKTTSNTEKARTVITDGISATEIAANAVGSTEIAASSVGNSEVATDAVDTLELVDESVSVDESAKTNSSITTSAREGWETIQSVTVVNTGDGAPFPVALIGFFEHTMSRAGNIDIRIRRDSTTIFGPVRYNELGLTDTTCVAYKDTPGSTGTHVYALQVDGISLDVFSTERVLLALGVKK